MGIDGWVTLKKLTEAARYWAGVDKPTAPPLVVDAGVAEGLRAFGVSEADIEAAQGGAEAAPAQADFEVYEDCWESVLFFLTVQTQWSYVSGGLSASRSGLHYPGVESGARMAGIRRSLWPGLLADVQVMERAVLAADVEMAPKVEK